MAYRDPALDWTPGATVTPAAWFADLSGNDEFFYGDTVWQPVTTFTNSWTAAAGASVFYAHIGRRVWLRGGVTGGTANTAAFTLPNGYQPAHYTQHRFIMGANLLLQVIVSGTTTTIQPLTSTTFYFSGVSWVVA